MSPTATPCVDGLPAAKCVPLHTRSLLPAWPRSNKKDSVCPCCDGKFCANPATDFPDVHLIGYCHGDHCADADIRAELERRGAKCLGKFGLKSDAARSSSTAASLPRHDAATIACVRRWYAVEKLPRIRSGDLYRMCITAIGEWSGDYPPSDPTQLLPLDHAEFISLAGRAGVERKYRYTLYRTWANHPLWEAG